MASTFTSFQPAASTYADWVIRKQGWLNQPCFTTYVCPGSEAFNGTLPCTCPVPSYLRTVQQPGLVAPVPSVDDAILLISGLSQ